MQAELEQFFFTHPEHLRTMMHLIPEMDRGGAKAVSIRLIEFFVGHYARTRDVSYLHGGRTFHVAASYEHQMAMYHKGCFDPCRRNHRLELRLEGEPAQSLMTTLGQLNFFRWFIQNGVLDYFRAHLGEVREAFQAFSAQQAQRRRAGAATRRRATTARASAAPPADPAPAACVETR